MVSGKCRYSCAAPSRPPAARLAPQRSRAGGVRGGAPRLARALPLPAGEGPALPQLEREPLSQRQPGKAVLSGGLAGAATTTNRVGPGSKEQRDRLSGKPGEPADALVMKLPPRAAAAQVVSMGNPHIKIEESPFKLNYSYSSPFLIKHYQT